MVPLYAPEYYEYFQCIADKCKHSCCIGWEIDVDDITLEKYKNLKNCRERILSTIDMKDTPHFKLDSKERCPHLNNKGLCEIILNLSEDYLCDICREHPRFYNDSFGCKEVGIGMACEEACRLILTSESYGVVPIGHIEGEIADNDFDTVFIRDDIYDILSDDNISYTEKLKTIYSEREISPSDISDERWREVIKSLEYLDENHKNMFLTYSSELTQPEEYEKILEKALAYFIYRHCTEAEDYFDYKIRLGFCLFCERLLASVLKAQKPKNIEEIAVFARIISEEIEYSEDNTEVIKDEF